MIENNFTDGFREPSTSQLDSSFLIPLPIAGGSTGCFFERSDNMVARRENIDDNRQR
jgi:hypothetical protein